MKRNFNAVLLTLDGEPMKDGAPKFARNAEGGVKLDPATGEPIIAEQAKDATLRSVCLGAISTILNGDEPMSGADKFALFQLANKINPGGVVDVTPEEIVKLKDRLAKAYGIMAYGVAATLLDADYVEPAAAAAPAPVEGQPA